MGTFFIYILKSSVFLALFYLCYRILLSKETFHRFNRMVLLSSIVFSFLLPFIEVTWPRASEISQPFLLLEEAMETVETKRLDVLTETPKRFTWNALMFLIYASGILFFLLRYVWSIMRMLRLLRNGRKEKMEDGITLYVHQAKVVPFSWMKLIAISEEDWAKHGEAILAHERAHIRYGHSWDLLLAQTCIFLQWFNPAAWFLKKELQIVHEYEVDEHVICNGMDASAYQLSIIEKAVGLKLFTIANSFNYSLLTKRVTMMNQTKSNRWARLKGLFVLPVAALAVVAFARPPIDELKYSFLNDKGLPTTIEMKRKGYFTSSMKDSVLVIVNEKVKGYGEEVLSSIPGEQIESVLSMHSESTVAEYGDKAKHGVIKITTKKENKESIPVKEKLIFQIADKMPEFPGGMKECMKFINQNTRYPIEAHRNGIHGRVLVSFVISEKGDIESPHIFRSVDPLLDAEALRVIKSMPKWKPGKQKGKAVNVRFTLPVIFKIQ